jgi:predicted Zn finger-like uncharacterized protein
MAVEALCPMCGAVFSLRDDMQGKMVRCTKCEQVFTVGGGAKAKPAGEKQSVQSKPVTSAKKASRDDDEDDEVSTAKKKRAAAQRGRDDDDDGGKAKAKKKRVYHDDDDDDDDVPRKPARKKSGGGVGLVLGIVGGVVALLFLVCGGLGYWFVHTANSVIDDANDQIANANNGNPGFPNVGDPFAGQKREKKVASVDDALRDLKSNNDEERRAALDWLAKANLDKGRQAEVSRAINSLLKDPDNGTREKAVNVLKVWGTKENVPGLVQILNETQPGLLPGHAYGAIEVLGMLQDERGAEPVWKFRDGAFTWPNADKALKAMGQAAGEKAALNHLDDPNKNLRDAARSLVVYYGTKDPAKVRQAVSDLKSENKDQRWAAAEFLATTPVVESERPAVAKGLNDTLKDSEGGVVENGLKAMEKWYAAENVPALVASLDDDRFPHRPRAMTLLGKLKDVRGAEPVAARLLVGGDRRVAADALIAMGPVAKPAVEKYATNPDKAVQKEVDRVLSSYGTDTSGLGLTRLLTELESPEGRRRGDAARALVTTRVDPGQQPKVAKALETAAADASDKGAQEHALKALAVWGTKESAPALIKIMDDKDKNPANVRHAAMDVLAKWKAEDAIKPIALNIGPDRGDRDAAAKALIAMGPDLGDKIEGIVQEGLKGTDKAIILECVKILGAVGTKASLTPLTNLSALAAKQKQQDVTRACQKAALDIQLRGK